MKKALILSIIVLFSIITRAQGKEFGKESLKTEMDSVSYTLGYTMGQQLIMQNLHVNPDIFYEGIKAAFNKNPLIPENQLEQILINYHTKKLAEQERERNSIKRANIEEGDKFLAENKKKEGVVTLPSGLQYKVLKEGYGPSPEDADTVTVQYRGYFIDGKEFDSSIKRKKPATFPVIGVIPGWTQALKLMKVGSKWELYIPYQLAYGENGRPGGIPPAKTLLFEVELLGIKKGY